MVRRFVLAIAGLWLLWSVMLGQPAIAQPLGTWNLPIAASATEAVKDLFEQLHDEFLPKLEEVLYPEQREQFSKLVGGGSSFRKAFKSLTLTPEQKMKLKGVLMGLPKKDAFASLTPEQKKQLVMKTKDLFKPTPAEIAEKVEAGLKAKGEEISAELKDKLLGK